MARAIRILGPALPLDLWMDDTVNIDEATGQAVNNEVFGAPLGTFRRLADILTT